jgi:hypothetical protein
MNTQTETTPVNTMQATEAFPVEDHSLPASEVIAQQQSALADGSFAPRFIP